jgi:hypothetical protein
MRLFAVLGLAAALLALAGACGGGSSKHAQSTPTAPVDATSTAAAAPSPTPGLGVEVGPDAAWTIPESLSPSLVRCHSNASDCAASIMDDNGASAAAIAFMEKTGWFLTEFREQGMVDVAMVTTPWRANSNTDWAMVNGSPNIVYAEDAGAQLAPDTSDAAYAALLAAHPGLVIWPSDSIYETMGDPPAGGQFFVFHYSLNDGCHACATGYVWRVALDFAQDGTYEGPRLLNICIGPLVDLAMRGPEVETCPPTSS